MPHEDYCYALERENHALNEKYESLRQQLDGWIAANSPNGWIDNLRQQLAERETRLEEKTAECLSFYNEAETVIKQRDEARQQLADHIKREVMLRDALNAMLDRFGIMSDGCIKQACNALAATDDLDGLILCDAVEVGWIGTGPRDRRCEFSESKPANSVMRDFNMKPLYRAWEQNK